MAPRLNNNFPNGTWRCCDSHIGIYIKSHQWPSHETTIVYLEGHDQETVNRCRAMMAQLISEEKSGGRDMLSTDEILGDRDKDLRRQAINNWRMCGAQGIGRAKTRGDGPGGGGVMNFGYSGNSERPAKTKYLPMSNEEFVFITGVGLQLIKEIQKHGVTFRVHIPPSHQFSSTPKPITAPDEDISAGRGLAMSFTGKTEEFSDFAMKRMRARLGERASETKGFSSAGLTINPGAHLLYVDVPDEKVRERCPARRPSVNQRWLAPPTCVCRLQVKKFRPLPYVHDAMRPATDYFLREKEACWHLGLACQNDGVYSCR